MICEIFFALIIAIKFQALSYISYLFINRAGNILIFEIVNSEAINHTTKLC